MTRKNKNPVDHTRYFLIVLSCTVMLVMTAFSLAETSPSRHATSGVKLIVRADDMGISQSTNRAVIESYQNGIVTAAEVIANGPWFLDAVDLLRAHPDLDVGVHLALTSEWERLKWRPVTHCPSLVDSNGYFHPVIWKNNSFGADQALESQSWDIGEIEQELRGQIELVKAHLPRLSHISSHMGFQSLSPLVDQLLVELAGEFGLIYKVNLERLDFKKDHSASSYVPAFLDALDQAAPGTDYLFVEHPAFDGPEMKSVYMDGYRNVATDRQKVTDLFTDQRVKDRIQKNQIVLINYKDQNR